MSINDVDDQMYRFRYGMRVHSKEENTGRKGFIPVKLKFKFKSSLMSVPHFN